MDDFHRAILSELGLGKFHSQSRDLLRESVGHWLDREVSDRELRAGIEWLRGNDTRGALIVSDSAWSGYWIAEDYQEVLSLYEQERRRSLNLLMRIRKQRDMARAAFEHTQLRMAI